MFNAYLKKIKKSISLTINYILINCNLILIALVKLQD